MTKGATINLKHWRRIDDEKHLESLTKLIEIQ
jgi:hypothetical protein